MKFDINQRSYQDLRDIVGERTKGIVVWLGSGLSSNAGIPGWLALKSILLDILQNKADSMKGQEDKAKLYKIIEHQKKQNNLWAAFGILQKYIGETTYRDAIRKALQPTTTLPVPIEYRYLWQLKIDGLISLNLDRLAIRAYNETNPGGDVVEFSGNESNNIMHVLNSRRVFLANLHGNVDNVSSWVFTSQELKELQKNIGYQTFLKTCLSTKTILFVGIKADDVAVGGHLESLAQHGVATGPHFWLTDRGDLQTDTWAERNGIKVIRYTADNGKHKEVTEFFTDLISYVPKEQQQAPPITPHCNADVPEVLPPLDNLSNLKAEEIRIILNCYANKIFNSNLTLEEKYKEYEEFCVKYDEAIYRAWYTTTEPDKNKLLSYTLLKEMARGAFGRVYMASQNEIDKVAIKVLHENIRRQTELLKSFRRGVRSMKILEQHHLAGIVKYIDAYEIPAFVTMEWVNGPNLYEAVKAQQIKEWSKILKVAVDLSRIINSAHALPERVLHRDLRPANIMLKDFYERPDAWELVILDFDLSWHIGSAEESVVHSTIIGYLAPEQMQKIPGESTRHSAVDSFGIGMTLYFILSRNDPMPEQHKHKEWEETVNSLCAGYVCSTWKSLPNRFSRIILGATQHKQTERWDVGQIQGENERLMQALIAPEEVRNVELLAEEIAARTQLLSNYVWNGNHAKIEVNLPTGLSITLYGNIPHCHIILELHWLSTGLVNRRHLKGNISHKVNEIVLGLEKSGWFLDKKNIDDQSFKLSFILNNIPDVAMNINKYVNSINKAIELIKF